MTLAETLRQGAQYLEAAGIDHPRLEARLLLAHAMGCKPEDLIRDPTAPAPDIAPLLARRAAHEPLAHITGKREFWSLPFRVSPATLIPRPDSETLIEAALPLCAPDARILDFGTGTGCLLLALLHERPGAMGVGCDIAEDAVRLARANARDLGLDARVRFFVGNWGAALGGRFDLAISNPPYIPGPDIPGLMPEVARHEPPSALDGGPDGLDAYRAIVAALPDLLTPGGAAVLELGIGQEDAVAGLARSAGFTAESRADLSGTPRAIILRPPP